MLERIQVKGFKSIRELDLELRPLNVLIGANGSGKSNFIEVFRLLNQIVERQLQRYVARKGSAEFLLYRGAKTTREIKIELQFEEGSYAVTLERNENDTLFFALEQWDSSDIASGLGIIQSGFRETNLFEKINYDGKEYANFNDVSRLVAKTLASWRVYHFHDTSDTAKMKLTQNLHDNEFLRPDGSNIAAFLYLLHEKYPREYVSIENTIKLAVPFFNGFYLRPGDHNPDMIMLEWREKNFGEQLKGHLLSDGTLRFICLTTLLMQPVLPSLILLDEPELGLHPFAINLLVDMLKSAATRTQVMMATHSPQIIDQLAPEDVIVVDRIDQASTFKRLAEADLHQWLEDYLLGELWQKNVFGGLPHR